jgi:hypothetical protein
MRLGRFRLLLGRTTPKAPEGRHAAALLGQWIDPSAPSTAPAFADDDVAAAERHNDLVWPVPRVALAEQLWGEGFLTPGGKDEALRLAAPLGLTSSSSVLLLGSALAGIAGALADEFACWVSGFEMAHELAAFTAAQHKKAGGETKRRVTIVPFNPLATVFRRRGFHHALVLEALSSAAGTELLHAAAQAIKPSGQLVLVQLVSGETPKGPDPALAASPGLDRRTEVLPPADDITRMLDDLRFDVRVVEDQTDRHRRTVMRGWATLVRQLDGPRPSPAYAAVLVKEAEQWMRHLRLTQSKRIRLMRWHAISRG